LHADGLAQTDRKVFTSYLNPKWSVENGGNFNYLDKNDNQWKILVPSQGLLVYNDNDEQHYTTPVHEGNLRISLQMFIPTFYPQPIG
jgi:Rps23 Pro-64 3,4-dihydroxylase Tpa1-like proline 4-hydroxylase